MNSAVLDQDDKSVKTEHIGFWIRVVAYLIDGIVLGIPIGTYYAMYIFPILMSGDMSGALSAMAVYYVISIGLPWLYFALMESRSGATLGKSAMGIKVVDANYEKLTFLHATGRYFAKILSAIIFFIGFMMAGFTAKKQALHDVLANTYVVKK